MTGIDDRALERLRALPAVQALAGEPGVWVVGGAVRDALLGRAFVDADFVVEGDAVALARRLGEVTEAHERFGTASVGGFDLASARTESYPAPGALPDVVLGASVQGDLARRDFTVNAIAVRLADFTTVAWPGAFEDLADGVLRVLHPGSFADDPTRLLRLVRYASRLEFSVDDDTAELAGAAVAGGALRTVSASRLGAELRLLLREPQPAALQWLGAMGLGDVIAGAIVDGGRVARTVGLADGGRVDLAALACCVGAVDAAVLAARLDELEFPAAERDLVVSASRGVADVGALRTAPASVVWRTLRGVSLEALAVAGDPLVLERWASVSGAVLDIDGNDLVAAGLSGPPVGAGLEAAMVALLDGEAPDRDAQLRVALAEARA